MGASKLAHAAAMTVLYSSLVSGVAASSPMQPTESALERFRASHNGAPPSLSLQRRDAGLVRLSSFPTTVADPQTNAGIANNTAQARSLYRSIHSIKDAIHYGKLTKGSWTANSSKHAIQRARACILQFLGQNLAMGCRTSSGMLKLCHARKGIGRYCSSNPLRFRRKNAWECPNVAPKDFFIGASNSTSSQPAHAARSSRVGICQVVGIASIPKCGAILCFASTAISAVFARLPCANPSSFELHTK